MNDDNAVKIVVALNRIVETTNTMGLALQEIQDVLERMHYLKLHGEPRGDEL